MTGGTAGQDTPSDRSDPQPDHGRSCKSLSVLLIGRRCDDLRPLAAELELAGSLYWETQLDRALALPQDRLFTHILCAPAWRGEFTHTQMLALTQRFPLARQIMLVTSWLEGETRSGRPWEGAERWYLDQAVARWQAEQTEARASWIPPTWSPDEFWQRQAEQASRWSQARRDAAGNGVVVVAELPATRDYLVELLQAAGRQAIAHRADQQVRCTDVAAVIYDAVADFAKRQKHVEVLARRYPSSRRIVLVNFPRACETNDLQQSGATAVLGKPFLNNDLLNLLGD